MHVDSSPIFLIKQRGIQADDDDEKGNEKFSTLKYYQQRNRVTRAKLHSTERITTLSLLS